VRTHHTFARGHSGARGVEGAAVTTQRGRPECSL